MIEKITNAAAKIPVAAEIEPPLVELRSLIRHRWNDLLPQSRKGVESAIASLTAALEAQQAAAKRHFVAEAAKGQLAPRRVLQVIRED